MLDEERLDHQLLINGACHVYRSAHILDEDIAWFRGQGYRVARMAAAEWTSEETMHDALKAALDFPAYYGRNLNALADCLSDLEHAGQLLVLDGFEAFLRRQRESAHGFLDVIEVESRRHLVKGRRLICLLHVDDPRLDLPAVGAVKPMWNPREWMPVNRGLPHPHG